MPPKAYAAEGSSPRSPISQMTTLPRSSKDRRQQQQQQQAVDFAHTHRGLVVREPSALLTRSLRSAITMGHPKDTPAPVPPAPPAQPSALAALPAEDPGDILLCDLGNKCLMVEDLENALRLWTRPAVLLAGRNSLDRLPVNIPGTILYLDLSWNRLTQFEGFAALPNLRELDVSHNGAQNMLGLTSNTDLRVLRISHNRIRRIEGLHQLKQLEEADFSHNLLRTKTDVRALSLNAALRRLRIEGNPFCATGVQHGTYQIAMQHLLPGMSLLDGKRFLALPGPPFLPPPPPPTPTPIAAAQHRADHPGPHRRVVSFTQHPPARGESLAENDLTEDLSVTRGWRDSPVVRRNPSLPAPKKQRSRSETPAVGGRGSCVRVTAGGGRPSIDPGSYAETFLASQRKGKLSATPSSTQSPTVPCAANGMRETRGGVITDRHVRHRDVTQIGSFSLAQVDAHRRLTARSDGGGCDAAAAAATATAAAMAAAAAGVGTKRRHHTGRDPEQQSVSTSLLSCLGMSRAERAAARRLAWSQARQEGAVGTTVVVQRRRSGSGKASVHGGGNVKRRATAARSLGITKSSSSPTPRGRSSSVPPHGLATTETRQTNTSQALPIARRSRRPPGAAGDSTLDPDRAGGGGSSSNVVASRHGAPSKQKVSSQRGGGAAARDGHPKISGRRPTHSSRQTGRSPTVGRRHNASNGVARATRVRAAARQYGSRSRAREKRSSSSPTAGKEGTYRYKTTLGQRGRCVPRPAAQLASPWTPRDDAQPWKERSCHGGDRARDNVVACRETQQPSSFSSRGYSAPDGEVASSSRRDESGRSGEEGTHWGEAGGRDNNGGGSNGGGGGGSGGGGGDDEVEDLGGEDDGGGAKERFAADGRGSRARRSSFISPLSPAGILQRASSARSSAGASSSNVSGIRLAEVRSQQRRTVANRWRETDLEHGEGGRGRGRRSTPSTTMNNSQGGSSVIWTDDYDRYHHRHESPDFPVDGRAEGGGGTAASMAWADAEPSPERPSRLMPRFSTGERGVDDDGARYQRPVIPVPSGNAYDPPDETSVQYHDGSGSGAGGGVGARGSAAGRTEGRPIQLQHCKVEQQQHQRAWRSFRLKENSDTSRADGNLKMTTPWNGTPSHDDAAESAMSDGLEPETLWDTARRTVAVSDVEEDKRGLHTERSLRSRHQRRDPAKSAAAVTNDQRVSAAEQSVSDGRIAYRHTTDHRTRAVVGRTASWLEGGATPEEDDCSGSHDFDPRAPALVRNRGHKQPLAGYFAGHASGRAERGTGAREGNMGFTREGVEGTASFENQVMDMLASMVGDHGAEAGSQG